MQSSDSSGREGDAEVGKVGHFITGIQMGYVSMRVSNTNRIVTIREPGSEGNPRKIECSVAEAEVLHEQLGILLRNLHS